MAWINGKRTVYCRTCYGVGHNRRGCPQISEATKARYKTGDLARKCSYCHTAGHTRRKCEKLTLDMANDVRQNSEYRHNLAAFMISNGLGIGALVKRVEGSQDDIFMIDDIIFDSITHRDPNNDAIVATNITDASQRQRNFTMPLDAPFPNNDYYVNHWYSCKVVSPADEEAVRGMISAEWLTGKSGLDKHYKKRR